MSAFEQKLDSFVGQVVNCLYPDSRDKTKNKPLSRVGEFICHGFTEPKDSEVSDGGGYWVRIDTSRGPRTCYFNKMKSDLYWQGGLAIRREDAI